MSDCLTFGCQRRLTFIFRIRCVFSVSKNKIEGGKTKTVLVVKNSTRCKTSPLTKLVVQYVLDVFVCCVCVCVVCVVCAVCVVVLLCVLCALLCCCVCALLCVRCCVWVTTNYLVCSRWVLTQLLWTFSLYYNSIIL